MTTDNSKRIMCPLPGFTDAWVELPDEWLVKHAMRRDEAVRATARLKSLDATVLAVSLAIAKDWGGIRGLEGRDPAEWDFSQVPVVLSKWLEAVVFNDFARAYTLPDSNGGADE